MPRLDWNNIGDVIAFAKSMGPGMVVVKHDDRPNLNITHAERVDLWDKPTVKVLFRT